MKRKPMIAVAIAMTTVNIYASPDCGPQGPGAAGALETFYTQHPTDVNANKARLERADIDFFAHRWPEALNLYGEADIKGLAKPDRSLYSYRMALCLIKTGHYSEAREWIDRIEGKEYADVRNFYGAYLDYINGDFKKAFKGFEKVTPGIPGLEAGYYMIQILYSEGKYNEVVERANRMMYRNPVPELAPEIHRVTGLSYFKLGEMAPARVSLHNYLDQNKGEENDEALYALGCIEYEDGNYAKAEEYFTPVTQDRTPLSQSAWLYLGQCRLMEDNVQGATLAFEKATAYETDPEVAQTAMYNYITSLTRGGNVPFSKSAAMLEAYINRWPGSPHVREVEEYLASAYFNDHDYIKAINCVDGVKGRPTRTMLEVKQKALYEQGVQTAANGDVPGSAKWFRQAAAMKETDKELANQSLLWLGDAEYAAGKYAQAIKDYQQFVSGAKKSANRTLGIYNLAYAQYRAGQYSAAAANFQKAADTKPALVKSLADDAMIRRADCLYYTGDYHTADNIYKETLSRKAADSDYAAYRHAMMTGLTSTQRDKVAALESFIREYPNSRWVSSALLEKALTHEDMGEAAQAAEARRKRLALTPDVDIDELLNVARTNDEAGDAPFDQLSILERIRREGSLSAEDLADIDLYEANARAALGEDDAADEIYKRLGANPSSLAGAVAAVKLGERDVKRGDYKKAFDEMSEFTETGTPHLYWLARGFITLADACDGMGRPELAREYLVSLRDNYPGNEPDILSAINTRLNKKKKK